MASSASAWSALPRGPTLFGKLPQRRDFIRIRHDYPAALAFDAWLQDDLAELAESELSFGDARVRFLFAREDASLVGVLHASRDRAGRAFPVSIFTPVPTVEAAATVWLAYEPFFTEVERLLESSAELSLDDLALRLDALPAPAHDALAAVTRGPEESDSVARFADLVEQRSGEAFDCPAPDFQDVAGFCRAAQQTGTGRLSIFWATGGTPDPGRALLCLRRIPPLLLGTLCQGSAVRGTGWTRL
jgi:type VI secretion system protein ImpM